MLEDLKVRCPFWKRAKRPREIRCEGLEDGMTIALRFNNEQNFIRHGTTFCCGRYEACEIYRAIVEAKYAEDLHRD